MLYRYPFKFQLPTGLPKHTPLGIGRDMTLGSSNYDAPTMRPQYINDADTRGATTIMLPTILACISSVGKPQSRRDERVQVIDQ